MELICKQSRKIWRLGQENDMDGGRNRVDYRNEGVSRVGHPMILVKLIQSLENIEPRIRLHLFTRVV